MCSSEHATMIASRADSLSTSAIISLHASMEISSGMSTIELNITGWDVEQSRT